MMEEQFNICDFRCEYCPLAENCYNKDIVARLEEALPEAEESPAAIRARIGDASFAVLRQFARENKFKLQQMFDSKSLQEEESSMEMLTNKEDKVEYKVEDSDCFKIIVIYENMLSSNLDRIYDWLDNQVSCMEATIHLATSVLEWHFNLIYIHLRRALFLLYGNKCKTDEVQYLNSLFIIINKVQQSNELWLVLKDGCEVLQKSIDQVQVVLQQLENDLKKTFPELGNVAKKG